MSSVTAEESVTKEKGKSLVDAPSFVPTLPKSEETTTSANGTSTPEASSGTTSSSAVEESSDDVNNVGELAEKDSEWEGQLVVTPYTDAFKPESCDSFKDPRMKLKPELLKAIFEVKNFKQPSKIQSMAIPLINHGPPYINMVGQAKTGSGKTAAFALGLLSRIDSTKTDLDGPQCVVMCHTRELATQNFNEIKAFGQFLNVSVKLLVAGVELKKSMGKNCLREQVLVATPGKINGALKGKYLNVSNVVVFVLDEADEMIDNANFKKVCEQVKVKIEKARSKGGADPKGFQKLLFSATFSSEVRKFVHEMVDKQANFIEVKTEELSLKSVKQFKIFCGNEYQHKLSVLEDLYDLTDMGQTIIFVNRRATGHKLREDLIDKGHKVTMLTGGQMRADERDEVMNEFRKGITQVLITTNVLSRGVDVSAVKVVINFDLPIIYNMNVADTQTYLHRCGRTGRYGTSGSVINLVGPLEKHHMENIEVTFDTPCIDVPADEAAENLEAMRISEGSS